MKKLLSRKGALVAVAVLAISVCWLSWAYAAPSITNVSASPTKLRATSTTCTSSTIRYRIAETAHIHVQIIEDTDTVVRSLIDTTQTAGNKTTIWNGKDDSRVIVDEGTYKYRITATAESGTTELDAGTITVDRNRPVISDISVSPEGIDDTSTPCVITYSISEDSSVTAAIYTSSGSLVKTIYSRTSKSAGENTASWDGTNSRNAFVSEGIYTYRLNATDPAGWTAVQKTGTIIVDRSNPAITLGTAPARLKATGTVTSTIAFTLSETAIVRLSIFDDEDALVKTMVNDTTLTAGSKSYKWNGKNTSNVLVDEGTYTFTIDATDTASNAAAQKTGTIYVDRTAPTITEVSATPDTIEDTSTASTIAFTLSEDCITTVAIYGTTNRAEKVLLNRASKSSGANTVDWDGKNAAGAFIAEGIYTYKINATDAAGWTATQQTGTIIVDRANPTIEFVSASFDPFSPKGTNTTSIRYTLSERSAVTVLVKDGDGATVRTLVAADTTQTAGTFTLAWNGKNGSNPATIVADDTYTVEFEATDMNANEASDSFVITIDTTLPTITVDDLDAFTAGSGKLNIAYTLSEEAEVTASIITNAGALVKLLCTSVPTGTDGGSLYWNGKNRANAYVTAGTYKLRVKAVDAAGNIKTTDTSFTVN